MALILSIETSTMVCSVALHKNGELLANQVHQVEKSHSSLLPGIGLDVCKEANVTFNDLDAVAVSSGPGSYTGLRIGVSNAKGICYTLKKPFIAIPSLEIMTEAVRGKFLGDHLLCPMMDARRMEVYTQMEDQNGKKIWDLQPRILDENTFNDFKKPLYLFGDGMPKFREIANQDNLIYIDDIFPEAQNMGRLAQEKFDNEDFEDVAYFEPNYLKEWRTTTPKKQLL
ncbi:MULTISPECIES: tRNA (adenosine(37)-N6)-threonylcarbamoyltransferase complex dimerization subunit type 1 TsaB [unclassified Ekhidna]|uniref:tRNA (adenosine(37)-N6)-threonylcarbamoyltransferase complex dimerization subunit type 1 TsaB n=1 Tax=unclassified Ekhidna TaxID=2632188 RepID=UPI0032DF7E0A